MERVPNFPGVKLAVGSGDPGKGAAHFFIEFTPGFAAPMHHHNTNHSVAVLAGTVVLSMRHTTSAWSSYEGGP